MCVHHRVYTQACGSLEVAAKWSSFFVQSSVCTRKNASEEGAVLHDAFNARIECRACSWLFQAPKTKT